MVKKGDQVGLYLSGQPVQIKECNIFITQPTIKDIVVFGEDSFLFASNVWGHPENVLDKMKEGNFGLDTFNDFQLLLAALNADESLKKELINFLELIFPDYVIQLTAASINFCIIQEDKEIPVGQLQPFNFEAFCGMIAELFDPLTSDKPVEYNPANDLAAEIAEKIKQGREKRANIKNANQKPQSLFARYISVLSIGLQLDINILFNYTPFQLYDAFIRYSEKTNSDFYMRVSTMPLIDTSKMKEPKDWVRNLYED